MILRWALRELKNSKAFSLFFVANLAIGLTGFLGLDAFKSSLDSSLKANAKNFLSADFTVAARRIIGTDQINQIEKLIPFESRTRLWEFFSMAAAGESSRLVQVKAIEEGYPFYGFLKLGSGRVIERGTEQSIQKKDAVWVYPELLAQLSLKVGDSIKLGERQYVIDDTVVDDSTQTFRLGSLAPKIYISLQSMQNSSLVSFGSTLSDVYLYKLPADVDPESIRKDVENELTDNTVRIDTPNEAGEDSARALQYLSDYLGLVSLVALFLAALGCAYLYRSYLVGKYKEVAIYNSLGLQKSSAQIIYLVQLFILGLSAALVSLVAARFLLPVIGKLLVEFTPIAIELTISLRTVGLAFLLGSFASLIVCFPFVMGLRRLNTAAIFQESSQLSLRFSILQISAFLPALLLYYVLSVWQANSIKIGSVFVVSFLGAFVLLAIFAWGLFRILPTKIRMHWVFRQGLLSITRKQASSMAVIVSLGLGSMLMSLMPQLRNSLKEELAAPKKVSLPSLFMFDIQDEQLGQLQSFFSQRNINLENLSPMVRARLLSVNSEVFERVHEEGKVMTREDEADLRFRNRGINLSFRPALSKSETLVSGKEFSGAYNGDGLPQLSLEERYAKRLGVKIGDQLTFDVQGVEITGEVVNFRKVKWNSFQPNFFILFQPGVLDDAPKTWLAALPSVLMGDLGAVGRLQSEIVKAFPNVSIIDVGRAVEKIFEVSEKMSWSLELMAALSLLAGLVVLYSLVRHQLQTRRWDINMLKILGGGAKEIRTYLLVEFGLLTFVSSLLGVFFSLIISLVISSVLFDGVFAIDWANFLFIILLTNVLAWLVVLLASGKVIRERALKILQEVRIGA